jgi:hypothetical protein
MYNTLKAKIQTLFLSFSLCSYHVYYSPCDFHNDKFNQQQRTENNIALQSIRKKENILLHLFELRVKTRYMSKSNRSLNQEHLLDICL